MTSKGHWPFRTLAISVTSGAILPASLRTGTTTETAGSILVITGCLMGPEALGQPPSCASGKGPDIDGRGHPARSRSQGGAVRNNAGPAPPRRCRPEPLPTHRKDNVPPAPLY